MILRNARIRLPSDSVVTQNGIVCAWLLIRLRRRKEILTADKSECFNVMLRG
jgi:hypothetical protein